MEVVLEKGTASAALRRLFSFSSFSSSSSSKASTRKSMLLALVLMGLYINSSGLSPDQDLAAPSLVGTVGSAKDDQVLVGFKGYTELRLGNANLFISVPHGGGLMPLDIANRTEDSVGNFKMDLNTQAFGETLRSELQSLFRAKAGLDVQPFLLFNHLHRIKMDPNRNDLECCKNVAEDSRIAYDDYHAKINAHFEAGFMQPSDYAQGLLLDIHGQSHPEAWIELGYLLKSSELNATSLAGLSTSLNYLASVSERPLDDLIRGESCSLGSFLQQQGLKTVPSPAHPSPYGGNYYSGGFIVQAHSSYQPGRDQYRLSAIQCELPYYMRANASAVKTHAKTFAAAVYDFYWANSFDRRL